MASLAARAVGDAAAVTGIARLAGERDRCKPFFHNGGAAMANATLAMAAPGRNGRWTF